MIDTQTQRMEAALSPQGEVVRLLRSAFPEALGIYAFGSQVQGTAREDSDLDLAVLVKGYAEPLALWNLANALTNQVGCTVDLLDLRAASTVMAHQVLTQGRRLWGADPAAGIFEAFVLSEKTALDEARAGLLADIAKEGRVYGR
jgi:predicted nucleotidyltransferase